jgi:hypothetical protein
MDIVLIQNRQLIRKEGYQKDLLYKKLSYSYKNYSTFSIS